MHEKAGRRHLSPACVRRGMSRLPPRWQGSPQEVSMSRVGDRRRRSRLLVYCAVAGLLVASASGIAPVFAQVSGAAIAAHGTAEGVPPCATCHGAHGEGNAENGFPRLAGLPTPYLRAQLSAFANGQRQNPVMAPIAKMLKPDEAQAVSVYFAGLPPPATQKSTSPVAGPGALLAQDGRWAAGIPPCVACHGPHGIGVGAPFPPLAGQPARYTEAQLKAWREGTRPPGPLGLMQRVARRLTPSDVAAVARWFAAQPAGGGK